MTRIDRRRLLQIGGAALTATLAGCSLFDDTTGVPGREAEAPDDGGDGGEKGAFGPAE